jgi:hypothetical protein
MDPSSDGTGHLSALQNALYTVRSNGLSPVQEVNANVVSCLKDAHYHMNFNNCEPLPDEDVTATTPFVPYEIQKLGCRWNLPQTVCVENSSALLQPADEKAIDTQLEQTCDGDTHTGFANEVRHDSSETGPGKFRSGTVDGYLISGPAHSVPLKNSSFEQVDEACYNLSHLASVPSDTQNAPSLSKMQHSCSACNKRFTHRYQLKYAIHPSFTSLRIDVCSHIANTCLATRDHFLALSHLVIDASPTSKTLTGTRRQSTVPCLWKYRLKLYLPSRSFIFVQTLLAIGADGDSQEGTIC